MNDDIAIKVDQVSKTFKLPRERAGSIKNAIVNFARREKGYEVQQVLNGISFEVKKGEFFGIVGRNGSGKSTLLKMLAGIYMPTAGSIEINGKLTPFIELGVGFNPELTGRENVYLNGSLLGFSRKEMDEMYEDIVEFAEIRRFMDQKLKNYSSGMQVRLAFSIAIRANTEILVLDEVLAVGDAAFQQKCNDYFEKLKRENKTIVLVTHSMDAVQRYCDRALLIHDGDIELIGSPKEVASQYLIENAGPVMPDKDNSKQLSAYIKSLSVRTKSPKNLTSKDVFEFEAEYELNVDLPVYLGISLMFKDVPIMQHNSRSIKLGHAKNRKYKVRYRLPLAKLYKSDLKIDLAIFKEETAELIGYKLGACEFQITTKEDFKSGPVMPDGVWSQTGARSN